MDVKTHAAAACAIFDALPRDAQEFLRLSDLELRHWARVPDEQDHDALMQTGCETGVECHAHSWKLGPDGSSHLTGSAATVIASAPRECLSAVREGHFDEAREVFVKAFSHYALDITTPWHVTRQLTSEQHRAGEKAIAKLAIASPIVPIPLAEPRSLYRSAVAAAEETHSLYVARLMAGDEATGELGAAILAHSVGFGLSVAHYIWRWLVRG